MIELQGQTLKNVVSFENTDVRFNENKVTIVMGLNLDSDKASPTSNGAGKSLLLSCPANTFFFSPPLSLKKKAKKELLGKGSCITQRLRGHDGNDYVVEQYATKYKIYVNGQDMELRTVPIAEKFIRTKLFPLSEVAYYTNCYVSTQRPFAIQSSSDADRISILTELFRLDDYDVMRRFFLDRVAKAKTSEVKLQVLERDMLEVRSALKKLRKASPDNAKVKRSAEKYKKEADGLTKKISTLSSAEFKSKSLFHSLKTLLSVERSLDELRSRYKSTKPPKEYASWLKTQRRLVYAYSSYEEQLASYQKSVDSTKRSIRELNLPDDDAQALTAKLAKAEKLRTEIEDELAELESTKDKLGKSLKALAKAEAAASSPAFRSITNDPEADYEAQIAECRVTLRLKKLLDHTHDDDSTTCPTCLSPVDLKSIAAAVTKAEKRIDKLNIRKEYQARCKVIADLKASIKEFGISPDELQSQIEKAEKRIESAAPYIREVKSALKILERHDMLTRFLKSIKKPEKPESVPDTTMTLEEIDQEIELCSDIRDSLGSRDKLIETNAELAGLRTVKAVKAKLSSTEDEVTSIGSELAATKTQLSGVLAKVDAITKSANEISVYEDRERSLTKKIDALMPEIEDKRLLEALAKAYSAKGIKAQRANEICSLLEQNLNTYSNLIFCEPFVFSVSATESGMSILVDRGNGHVSDVRNLSGAESNAFRLLYVMSSLPLTPDAQRVNMLTLDEPCAHMDEIARTKFLRMFLPALSEIVPNIFIITPNPSDYCEGAKQWIVRKERGKSTVVQDAVPYDSPADAAKILAKAQRAVRGGRKTKQRQKPGMVA